MIDQIQEILRNKNNLFDFEIIEILISKYGFSASEKEWFNHPIDNKLAFNMIFRESLKDHGIAISYEKVPNGNYYSYYHRFNLV